MVTYTVIVPAVCLAAITCSLYFMGSRDIQLVSQPVPGRSTDSHISLSVYTTWVIVTDTEGCSLLKKYYPDCIILILTHNANVVEQQGSCIYMNPTEVGKQMIGDVMYDYNSLTVACLYAIQMGAEALYIPDENSRLNMPKWLTHKYTIVPDSNDQIFTPEQYFGCRYSGPNMSDSHSYKLCRCDTAMMQVLADIPYIESQSCDPLVSNVMLPVNMYTTFVVRGAWFKRPVFWVLFLTNFGPPDEANKKEYVALTIAVQKLLWLQGINLVVYHDKHSAHVGEGQPVITTDNTVDTIKDYSCSHYGDLSCYSRIFHLLSMENIISRETKIFIEQWLVKINQILYMDTPKIESNLKEDTLSCQDNKVVYFTNKLTSSLPTKSVFRDVNEIKVRRNTYKTWCSEYYKPDVTEAITHPPNIYNDILLVVIFNNPFYSIIPYLELMYRSYFPHIVYCGPKYPKPEDVANLTLHRFMFIKYTNVGGHPPGSFNYECMTLAMRMDPHVSGYLALGDDVILFPEKLQTFNTSLPWYLSRYKTCDMINNTRCDQPRWVWWKRYRQNTIDALEQY